MPDNQTIELTEMRDGKPVIRYFVSYAHDDKDLKDKLLKPLKQRLAIAKDYCFEAWDDGEILAGERWHEQIQAAVAHCQFGLLLVTPAFLSSEYIQNHELRAFVTSNLIDPEPEKRAVPVALKRIPFDNNIDLKGLERLQIFRDSAGRAFEERVSRRTRDDFASELFQQILKIVKRYGAHPHLTESESYVGADRKDDQVSQSYSEVPVKNKASQSKQQIAYNIAAIRKLVAAALGDQELKDLCFDHFPAVYSQFTAGQSKDQRVLELVDYANRHFEIEKLLVATKKANFNAYTIFESQLVLEG